MAGELLTKLREWRDEEPGKDPDEWPAAPTWTEYRAEGQMRADILARIGRDTDDPADVRIVQGVVEGGYSEWTVEHDYPLEVWIWDGKQGQRVYDDEFGYSENRGLAALLVWLDEDPAPVSRRTETTEG